MQINSLFFTGLSDVDKALGGIAPGEILFVSAPPATGKTVFCISSALAPVKQSKVVFLTSSSPYGLAKRLEKYGQRATLYLEQAEGISLDEISEAIPSEMEMLFQKYAYEMPFEETKDLDPVEKYTREIPAWLMIIDSIDYVYKYYPKQDDRGELRCKLLQKYIKEIKRLAKKYRAAVILTAMALESDREGIEFSCEVASCANLIEYLILLDGQVVEIRKNIKSGPGVITLKKEERCR